MLSLSSALRQGANQRGRADVERGSCPAVARGRVACIARCWCYKEQRSLDDLHDGERAVAAQAPVLLQVHAAQLDDGLHLRAADAQPAR